MAEENRGADIIARTIDQVLDGSPAIIHLTGPRGSGRTWHLDRAASVCASRQVTVLRSAGRTGAGAPVGGIRQLLRGLSAASAESVGSSEGADDDGVLLAVREVASTGPVAVLIDDVDELDPDSIDALAHLVRGLDVDPIAVISTAVGASPWRDAGGDSVRLEPLSDEAIERLLVVNGVADGSARQCAAIAGGNPGLALAIADGLTTDQRRGRAPIASLPRPAGTLADDLRSRLSEHGERISRALVVSASEPGGDVEAVRTALAVLGEPPTSLDEVEEAGLIEIIGSRLIFTDPWTALVAPALVAPASRRAAHGALAAAFTRPDQAAARAWQLAAAANGPSDDVARALGLVATDSARRGALRTAVTTAERAAEFAEDQILRIDRLLDGLEWALDAGDTTAVERIVDALNASTVDHHAIADAVVETDAYLHGGVRSSGHVVGRGKSAWTNRRDNRLALTAALAAGDHATALTLLGEGRTSVPGTDARPSGARFALAHRHRGDVREARSALLATAAGAALIDPAHVLAPDAPFDAWIALLVAADLNVLAGRGDDATSSLEINRSQVPDTLTEWAATLMARAALQSDPTIDPATQRDAFTPFGSGPLLDVRVLVATGVTLRDLDALDQAIDLAERSRLPIEAAEARLWALPMRGDTVKRDRSAAAGALQRCGVRGWDRRIEHLGTTGSPDSSSPTAVARLADPDVDALSAAERRVADAVASGMTNRETAASLIVSVKTVDFHLQQIYRKLGIRSRTELAIRMMGHSND